MRFYGTVGFVIQHEKPANSGIYVEEKIERSYYGDVLNKSRRLENSGNVNDDISISNDISIVADSFCVANLYSMKYVCWLGNKWKISSVDVDYPRMRLSLGGLYNG